MGEKVWGFPALFKGKGVHLSDDLTLCVCWLVTGSSGNGGES